MNTNYFYDYVSSLERVLSSGYKYKYSLDVIEKRISKSSYFQKIENDKQVFTPIITDSLLVDSIFSDIHIDLDKVDEYKQTSWAAESYMHIQNETGLTFEAILIVFPISKMYHCFDIYHEMDFSQIISLFNKTFEKESILSILMKRYNFSADYVSKELNISKQTIYSLKQRKRNIQKCNVDTVISLARLFKVRLETIAEIRF